MSKTVHRTLSVGSSATRISITGWMTAADWDIEGRSCSCVASWKHASPTSFHPQARCVGSAPQNVAGVVDGPVESASCALSEAAGSHLLTKGKLSRGHGSHYSGLSFREALHLLVRLNRLPVLPQLDIDVGNVIERHPLVRIELEALVECFESGHMTAAFNVRLAQ